MRVELKLELGMKRMRFKAPDALRCLIQRVNRPTSFEVGFCFYSPDFTNKHWEADLISVMYGLFAPAELLKQTSCFDLPIAIGIQAGSD